MVQDILSFGIKMHVLICWVVSRSQVLDEGTKDQMFMLMINNSKIHYKESKYLVKINIDKYVYLLIEHLYIELCLWCKANGNHGRGKQLYNGENTIYISLQ